MNVNKGSVYFDEFEDKKKYKSIQNIIGYVPQTVSIFDESFNLMCLTDKLNRNDFQKFNKALEIVDMKNFVDSLPEKYETLVGEDGSRLSGGQNQRLGIARAIYKSPKILILDEGMSALDIPTEEKIIKNILENLNDITLIVISHRPSSLKFCDKIYEVKDLNLKLKSI